MADEKKEKKTYRYIETSEGQSEKSRFWVSSNDAVFTDADPVPEEEKVEAVVIWDAMTLKGTSKGKKKKMARA